MFSVGVKNMKNILLILICLFVLPAVLSDVSVQHEVPKTAENELIVVSVLIDPDSDLEAFDIAEFIPVNWEIENWEIDGYDGDIAFESYNQEYRGEEYKMNHWQLNDDVSNDIGLEFTISGKSEGNYDFVSVWTYPIAFGSESYDVTVVGNNADGAGITGFAVNPVVEESNDIVNTISDVLKDINSIELY